MNFGILNVYCGNELVSSPYLAQNRLNIHRAGGASPLDRIRLLSLPYVADMQAQIRIGFGGNLGLWRLKSDE